MNPSRETATTELPDRLSSNSDRFLDDVVIVLMTEFAAHTDRQTVTEVVHDCYESLHAHVPRTADTYLLPWARRRILGRLGQRRAPSVTEMLSIPVQRL